MAHFLLDDLLIEARKSGKRVTQTDLAKAAGISHSSMWKIINNETKAPDPKILLAVAKVFTDALGRKITLDDLIGQNGDKEPPYIPAEGEASQLAESPPEQKRYSLGEGETISLKDAIPVKTEDFVALPILGDIPCGNLDLIEEENIVGYEWMHKDMVGKGEFFVRAKGDSMHPVIMDGDLLLIEPGSWWDHKTIVAAYVDGEATCKYIHISNGHSMLVPENRQHAPILVTDDMHIIGRVTKVTKNFVEDWRP